MMLKISSLILASLAATTNASKDDSYFMAGSGNPNTGDFPMYWKDSYNVLQDLDQFDGLYVEFHHCAWTMMQYPDQDESVDESDYWYMGKVPPMGANVAFSLYGQLKGKRFSGCGQDTFIKSFYTTQGYTAFVRAMYYAGVNGFSYIGYDDDDSSYGAKCNGGYGVGCTYSYGFTMMSYSSDTCDPQYAYQVKDTMSSLNSAMNGAQCVQIYDSNNYDGYVYGTPLEILAYSRACMYQNFYSPEGECPDPYGMLAQYQTNFNNGIKQQQAADPYTYKRRIVEGQIIAGVGAMMVAIAAYILYVENKNPKKNPLNKLFAQRKVEKKAVVEEEPKFTQPTVELTEQPSVAAAPSVMSAQSMKSSPSEAPVPEDTMSADAAASRPTSPVETQPAAAPAPTPVAAPAPAPTPAPVAEPDGLMKPTAQPKKKKKGFFGRSKK